MKMPLPFFTLFVLLAFQFCTPQKKPAGQATEADSTAVNDSTRLPLSHKPKPPVIEPVVIRKELLYDKHTLTDTYPYKDTTRRFQWEKIWQRVAMLDSLQREPDEWAVLQNYRNRNGEAPLVRHFLRNSYKRITDSLGVERYQSVPLYAPGDSIAPERYGRDGELVKRLNDDPKFMAVETICLKGKWLVPVNYVKPIADTVVFKKAIFVDRTNQNIATLEKVGREWLVRSLNPATTGQSKPPYAQETPLGIFVVQEKKPKMIFLVDGSTETGGFAPYASRFTNGGYIHGVPVNAPGKTPIEFSQTLGTVPRSHMCVRNATSHARFIYDWGKTEETLVFVFD